MMNPRTILASLAIVLVTLAQGGCEAEPPPADGAPRLVGQGAEPRRALRLTAQPGEDEVTVIKSTADVTLQVNGEPPQAMRAPTVVMPVLVTTTAMDGGAVSCACEFQDPWLQFPNGRVPGAEMLLGHLETMDGSVYRFSISDRGVATREPIQTPEDADPLLRNKIAEFERMLRLATIVLPEEPVGVGASWRVRAAVPSPVAAAGAAAAQVIEDITCTLTALGDSSFTIEVSGTQTPEATAGPSDGNAAKPRLLRASISGTLTYSAGFVHPAEASLDVESTVELPDVTGGPGATMKQVTSTRVRQKTTRRGQEEKPAGEAAGESSGNR